MVQKVTEHPYVIYNCSLIRFPEIFQPARLIETLKEGVILAHPDELVLPVLGLFMSNAHSTQISILEIWM